MRRGRPDAVDEHQQDTGETVLHGQGEMHLNTTVDRLARNYGLKITTQRPQVAYKETIRRAVHEHGRLKSKRRARSVRRREDRYRAAPTRRRLRVHRQGRRRRRCRATSFRQSARRPRRRRRKARSAIRWWTSPLRWWMGSSTRRQFRHGVQDRHRMAMQGRPGKADPVLLEPIDHVTISVPNEFTARAQRLLTGRRGQILGYAERPGWLGLGRCGGAGARSRVARPDHRVALADTRPWHISAQIRPSGRVQGGSQARRGMTVFVST